MTCRLLDTCFERKSIDFTNIEALKISFLFAQWKRDD